MKKNFDFNNIGIDHEITQMDAQDLMYERKRDKDWYDVIDLDPYGTAVPFLDSAIQACANGGMICVTFTDLAVLAGAKYDVCYYKYDSV